MDNIDDISYKYDTLKWFKNGWYRKFKKTEFLKSVTYFNKVYMRAIIAKERFCDLFGYDEDDLRDDSELF